MLGAELYSAVSSDCGYQADYGVECAPKNVANISEESPERVQRVSNETIKLANIAQYSCE